MNIPEGLTQPLIRHTQSEILFQTEPKPIRYSTGLGPLATHYDAFLVDQWGVLHNGHAACPEAVQCLRRLTRAGKQVVIISNSGKRSESNEIRLDKLGIPRDSYAHLVTSGEIAWQMLATGRGIFRTFMDVPGLLLTSDRPEEFSRGLGVCFVDHVEQAGFILLAGINDELVPSFYDHVIKRGLEKNLPMVCVNPDLTRITPYGLQAGAGAIAQTYQKRGGSVHYIGKPHPEIYRYCLDLLPGIPTSRVLAVGDSIHHDVVGGHMAGLDTLLTLQGVHVDDFVDTTNPDEIIRRIRKLTDSFGAVPDWVVPGFRW
ncbi:MAG: TIGR01459 family HAD-type hydrolase [Methylophilaceae bacterium]|nr:TIGR01459 family HAD-type hydrolase [Methylophilaceae bacterium]